MKPGQRGVAVRLRLSQCGAAKVKLALGQSLGLGQRLSSADVEGCDIDRGVIPLDLGPRAVHRDLVGPRIDGEECVARLDQLAVLKVQRIDEARHTGAHLNGLRGDEPARELVPVGDDPGERVCDRNRRQGSLGHGVERA